MTAHCPTPSAAPAAVTVSTRHLVAALAKVTPAAAPPGTDEVTRTRGHVHAVAAGGWLHLLAGDNHRIHYARIPLIGPPAAQPVPLPLPLELGPQLRRDGLHRAGRDLPIALAPSGSAGLNTCLVGTVTGRFPAVFDPADAEEVARAGRSMWASLRAALDAAQCGQGRSEEKISPAFLTDALKASRDGQRVFLTQAHLQSLPDRRVLVSAAAGSFYGFRAVIMGQHDPTGPRALREEHRQLRDHLPDLPPTR